MHELKDKDLAIAYCLLIFCGFLGIHRFYLGKNISDILFILLSYSCLAFSPAIVFVTIWLIIDLFLLPTFVKSANTFQYSAI